MSSNAYFDVYGDSGCWFGGDFSDPGSGSPMAAQTVSLSQPGGMLASPHAKEETDVE